MIKISLDAQLMNLDNLYHKSVDYITLEETINLIFYATIKMTDHDDTWKDYYAIFQRDLTLQNDRGWPKLVFTRNDSKKRLDSLMTQSFIPSDNLLLLLLQLLYIEKNKENNNIYVSFERYDILSHYLDNIEHHDIEHLSLIDIFEILETYMGSYINLYNNKMLFEYKLSKNILAMLNN